jgi:hypothetical protein
MFRSCYNYQPSIYMVRARDRCESEKAWVDVCWNSGIYEFVLFAHGLLEHI